MAAPIPENWVTFALGERKVLRFARAEKIVRTITDPVLKTTKPVESLHIMVTMENGKPVNKVLSVVSMKLAQELAPYLGPEAITKYEFVIEKPLDKFAPPRLVEVRPIT
jgi:hypothetical protein